MIKQSTLLKLYEDALKVAEEDKIKYPDQEIEVVLVPIVIRKRNGNIANMSGVNHRIIFDEESNQEK